MVLAALCLPVGMWADNPDSPTAPGTQAGKQQPVTHQPVTHPTTHSTTGTTQATHHIPTATHRTATTGTHAATHSTVQHRTTTHPGTIHSASVRHATHHPTTSAETSTTHRSAGTPVRSATVHHSTSAANHTATTASHKAGSHAKSTRPRRTSSQQRLARLHLQPERTQEIQSALIREGYLKGEASGDWDTRTHDAMLHYQTDHGFPATGLPEAKSLMKLGLGSHPLPPELDQPSPKLAPPAAAVTGDAGQAPPLPPASQ